MCRYPIIDKWEQTNVVVQVVLIYSGQEFSLCPLCVFLQLFHLQVISKSSEEVGDSSTEEKYLIATSEQPLCALHR